MDVADAAAIALDDPCARRGGVGEGAGRCDVDNADGDSLGRGSRTAADHELCRGAGLAAEGCDGGIRCTIDRYDLVAVAQAGTVGGRAFHYAIDEVALALAGGEGADTGVVGGRAPERLCRQVGSAADDVEQDVIFDVVRREERGV